MSASAFEVGVKSATTTSSTGPRGVVRAGPEPLLGAVRLAKPPLTGTLGRVRLGATLESTPIGRRSAGSALRPAIESAWTWAASLRPQVPPAPVAGVAPGFR